MDKQLTTTAEMSISDIVADIKSQDDDDEQDEPGEELIATSEPITTAAQARDALIVVRRFLEQSGSEKSITALESVQVITYGDFYIPFSVFF